MKNVIVEHVTSPTTGRHIEVVGSRTMTGMWVAHIFGSQVGRMVRSKDNPREWCCTDQATTEQFVTVPTLSIGLAHFGQRYLQRREVAKAANWIECAAHQRPFKAQFGSALFRCGSGCSEYHLEWAQEDGWAVHSAPTTKEA